jgi:ABC-type multidrug transport system fused ATPase/permease subunit
MQISQESQSIVAKQDGMAPALRSVTESCGANHRQQVMQRALQIVVDNNIVEFGHMPHLIARRGHATERS